MNRMRILLILVLLILGCDKVNEANKFISNPVSEINIIGNWAFIAGSNTGCDGDILLTEHTSIDSSNMFLIFSQDTLHLYTKNGTCTLHLCGYYNLHSDSLYAYGFNDKYVYNDTLYQTTTLVKISIDTLYLAKYNEKEYKTQNECNKILYVFLKYPDSLQMPIFLDSICQP